MQNKSQIVSHMVMRLINVILFIILFQASNISLANSKNNINNNQTKVNNMQEQSKPKFLFFAGSARKESLNKMLAHNAYEIAKGLGADATFIDLKEYPLPIYDGDLEKEEGLPEVALILKKIFIDHDGIFIASPEYNSSFTPLLKNTLDWVSRTSEEKEVWLKAYQNKIFALGAASPGPLGGQRGLVALQTMFNNMSVSVAPKKITIPSAMGKFNKDGKLTDEALMKELTTMVKEFISMTNSLKNN